jgi:hypothetical protein
MGHAAFTVFIILILSSQHSFLKSRQNTNARKGSPHFVFAVFIVPKSKARCRGLLQLYCGYCAIFSKQRGLHSTTWNNLVKRKSMLGGPARGSAGIEWFQ